MSETPVPTRMIRCPRCGGPSLYAPGNRSRPFCSPRCKNNDFGAWATEAYRVENPMDAESGDPAGETSVDGLASRERAAGQDGERGPGSPA